MGIPSQSGIIAMHRRKNKIMKKDFEGLDKKDTDLGVCKRCEGKGWHYVIEYFLGLQGRKDCNCK